MKSNKVLYLIIAAVVSFTLLLTVAPAAAQTSTCGQWDLVSLVNNSYIYQQNEWNSTLTQCATAGPNAQFTLTTANFNMPNGSPATYPSLYKGCHPFGGVTPNQGVCTTNSNMPILVSNITAATTSVSATVGSGDFDYAYDIWFTTNGSTQGNPNGGTELMIWLNHGGFPQPFGSQIATATIAGTGWDVWAGNQAWKTISYRRQSGTSSASNLDLRAFFNDAISRGYLSSSYYLMDVEMGFEIWTSGQGKAINSYSVSVSGSGGGGPTFTPTSGTGPTATPTRTNTPGGPTPTRTPTASSGGSTCSPVNATITAPFTQDGAGTFCWQSSNLGSYINSWNLAKLTVNGVDFTNKYAFTSALPAKINGYWYVSYVGNYAWSHFEAK